MKCRIQTLRKEVWFTPNMNSGREKWSCVWDFGGCLKTNGYGHLAIAEGHSCTRDYKNLWKSRL